jgi:hypothetical protein
MKSGKKVERAPKEQGINRDGKTGGKTGGKTTKPSKCMKERKKRRRQEKRTVAKRPTVKATENPN